MKIISKLKLKKKYLKILVFLVVGIVVIIIGLVLFKLTGLESKTNNKASLEEKMTTMVSSFYDKNIKGSVIGINIQVVTLKDLESKSYDISEFVKAECSMDSYSYVILDNPKETDIKKITYTVEHYLDCK